MKRWVLLGISLVLLLELTACSVVPDAAAPEDTVPEETVPEETVPEETCDLVYDMKSYQWFADIFNEKTVEEWNSMGCYTILLEGLRTPVVVNMDGTSVLSVSACDQTVELGSSGLADEYHEGYSPVYYIRSTQDTVVIRVSNGEYDDDSILITKGRYFMYPNEGDGSVLLWVEDDGTLGFQRTFFSISEFEQRDFEALTLPTGRDELVYETGSAEIVDGEVEFTVKETVVLSDLFDLDAMFVEARAVGWFEEYETVDELFEANKNRV